VIWSGFDDRFILIKESEINMPSKRKPTVRELEDNLNGMASRIDSFLNMFVKELEKHNMIISKLLESLDMMHIEVCPHCDGTIRTPILEGIDKVDDCPYCNEPLRESVQTTLHDVKEEE
tara:strand:- start:389 stop:745 length:357 start_codon:yes stop_codon:yes gene_type:complete